MSSRSYLDELRTATSERGRRLVTVYCAQHGGVGEIAIIRSSSVGPVFVTRWDDPTAYARQRQAGPGSARIFWQWHDAGLLLERPEFPETVSIPCQGGETKVVDRSTLRDAATEALRGRPRKLVIE